jgi:phage FluMu gp28-like protein
VVSPSERQSGLFLDKAAEFVRQLELPARGDGRNRVSLRLPNGSRIVGLPSNESKIRGYSSVSLMLIDEAARVDDDLYAAVRPMLGVTDGDLWMLSTPMGKQGFFYRTWESGDPDWTRIRVPVTECPRISAKFLEKERREQGDRRFRQDYLCEFVATDGALFDEALIRSLMTDDVKPLFPDGGGIRW